MFMGCQEIEQRTFIQKENGRQKGNGEGDNKR